MCKYRTLADLKRLRAITLGNLTIDFKRTAPSKLYWAGRPAMRIVQALQAEASGGRGQEKGNAWRRFDEGRLWCFRGQCRIPAFQFRMTSSGGGQAHGHGKEKALTSTTITVPSDAR